MLKTTVLALATLSAVGFASTTQEASAAYAAAPAGLVRLAPTEATHLVHYGPYHCHRGYYGVRCHGFRRYYRPYRRYYRPYGYSY